VAHSLVARPAARVTLQSVSPGDEVNPINTAPAFPTKTRVIFCNAISIFANSQQSLFPRIFPRISTIENLQTRGKDKVAITIYGHYFIVSICLDPISVRVTYFTGLFSALASFERIIVLLQTILNFFMFSIFYCKYCNDEDI